MVGFTPTPNGLGAGAPIDDGQDPTSSWWGMGQRDPRWTYGSVLPMAEHDIPAAPLGRTAGGQEYSWAWPTAARDFSQGVHNLLLGAAGYRAPLSDSSDPMALATGGRLTAQSEAPLLAWAARGLGGGEANPNELGMFLGKRALQGPPEAGRWFAGVDGQPRFEITDYPSMLHPERIPPAEAQMAIPLHQAFDHPELYANYPHLRDTRLGYESMPKGYNGYTTLPYGDDDVGAITLNSNNPPGAQHSTLLHEIQHMVQEHEGFEGGTAPEVVSHQLGRAMDLAAVKHEAALKSGDYQTANQAASDMLTLHGYMLNPKYDPFDAYEAAAGETEARNVQSRWQDQIKYGLEDPRYQEQFMQRPIGPPGQPEWGPLATMDVPPNKQFLFNLPWPKFKDEFGNIPESRSAPPHQIVEEPGVAYPEGTEHRISAVGQDGKPLSSISYTQYHGSPNARGITNIWTHPDARRSGLASSLIDRVAQQVGYKNIHWGVRTDEGQALKGALDKKYGANSDE